MVRRYFSQNFVEYELPMSSLIEVQIFANWKQRESRQCDYNLGIVFVGQRILHQSPNVARSGNTRTLNRSFYK
jgi:hypothetical protein